MSIGREVRIYRDEAEYLVDLLESLPHAPEHWLAEDIADTLREAFGMTTPRGPQV